MFGAIISIAVDSTVTAPDPGSTGTNLTLAILGSAGVGAILAALVNGLFSKRKLGAEATEMITNAAASVVKNMQADLDRQVAANTRLVTENQQHVEALVAEHREQMQALANSHAAEMEQVRRVLQLHVAWDAIAIAKLNDLGVDLPPAPPLLPPIKFEHPEAKQD